MSHALIVSGHLVDLPGREPSRFPQYLVARMSAVMDEIFDEWAIGPETTVICGGARGADIIGAELALRRHASVRLCLALPPQEFARESVDLPGTDWRERFENLRKRAQVQSPSDGTASGGEAFARANGQMVELAFRLDSRPRAIVVWDGKMGDGLGGTAHLVQRLGYERGDPRLRIVDPTGLKP
jgi:hypothetical protein